MSMFSILEIDQNILFMNIQIEEKPLQLSPSIDYLRAISSEDMFREALGDIYSDRYFQDNAGKFGKHMFIFEVKNRTKSWSLMKNEEEISGFLNRPQIYSLISVSISQQLKQLNEMPEESQGALFESSLRQVIEANPEALNDPFFEAERDGFGTFSMRKRSGGRYKQANCCKLGSILQRWKKRSVAIFLKGVAYYNEKGDVRQFLCFGHGFHFDFGKPSTGIELGLTLYANNRQLSLQACNVKDFIYFLFTLRSASRQSCYLTINRFNSFSPLRYESTVKFYIDGKNYFSALFEAIQKAQKSILIMGWMLSPQFLIQRQTQKITFEEIIKEAAKRGVTVSIILYHEPMFLPNGSQYTKKKLETHENIKVVCHPCGTLPTLWSHHGKLVIVDQSQAFVGGLDICYGRYDTQQHPLFPPMDQYPGIEHNNARKNDQWNVKAPNENSIPAHECRLPWHDVAQSVKGNVVIDLTHHFYQMWSFIGYENRMLPDRSYAPSLFETDAKSVFSMKMIVEQETNSNILNTLENKIDSIRSKGKEIISKVKSKFVPEDSAPKKIKGEEVQDYFGSYVKEVQQEIKHIQNKRTNKRTKSSARNSGCRSQRYSVADVKGIQEVLQKQFKQEKLKKTNSFLLCGQKKTDFFALEIDQDYVSCLEKLKSSCLSQLKINKEAPLKDNIVEVDSDDELGIASTHQIGNKCGRDQCQVVRSVGNWSIGCHPHNTEFSIHIAYLQLISQAKHYIYIENQFFVSSLANQELVKNQVASALYLRIRKAIKNDERFVVYVLLPLLPGFSGDLQVEDCTLLRKTMQWQYDTICRGENSLYHRLLNHTNNPGQYIQFLSLRTHGRQNQESAPQTEMIYVHSKLMIIDDEVVVCGSANINDRSLMGDRDSEIAIVSRGDDFVESKMNGSMVIVSQSAQQLRIKLWKEHFGMEESELVDPIAKETWEKIAERAAQNTQIYNQIFGCYPSDEITNRKELQEKRKQGKVELYDELAPSIKGHVVEFPLHFLQKQPLSCLVTEKEFYMPTECLT